MKPTVVYDEQITKNLQPYGVDVLFARDENHAVVDILIPMTDAEYSQFLLHFEDQQQSWKSSSYVYIFQNQLSGYQQWYDENIDGLNETDKEKISENAIKIWMDNLRGCTQLYADLEDLINKRLGIGGELPGDILEILDNIKNQLMIKLNAAGVPPEDSAKLLKDLDSFIQRAKEVVDKLPRDPVEIKHLFSLQRENTNLPCVGHFLSKQLYELASIGQKNLNRITDNQNRLRGKFYNRLKNQFAPLVSQNRLSDAKSQIERKRSAYGTEFNSNWAVIPPGMLNALRENKNKGNLLYTSMARYVRRMDDREEVDHLLRQVAHIKGKNEDICPKHYHERKLPRLESIWRSTVRIFAAFNVVTFSVVEMLILPVLPRLILSVLAGTVGFVVRDLIYNPVQYTWNRAKYWFGRLRGDKEEKLLNRLELDETIRAERSAWFNNVLDIFDSGLSIFHERISPVIFFKELRDSPYTDDDGINQLHEKLGPSQSFFKRILDRYDSGVFADYFRNMTKSVLRTIFVTPVIGIRNAIVHPFQNKDAIYLKYQKRANEKLLAEFKKMWEKADNPEAADPHVKNRQGPGKDDIRQGVRDMQTPDIQSFMHFMQSIVVVLGDDIFDTMFRKSPGFSTLAFMAASASFGIMLAPNAAPVFAGFSQAFAKATMGKEIGGYANATMVMNDMFTATLQFKALFLAMEGAKAVATGESKLLKDIFRNPEEALLAFCVSSGVGVLMGMAPSIPGNLTSFSVGLFGHHVELPNIYAAGINLFITEAAECLHHGTLGATSIEFSFLSVKLGFMIKSLGEGLHRPSRDPSPILDKMTVAYQKLQTKPQKPNELAAAFNPLFLEKELDKDDQALLVKQFHYSLVFDAMFKAYKKEKHERINSARGDGQEYKKPSMNELQSNYFTRIFNEHGIANIKDQEYFINGFSQALDFAKEKAQITMQGLTDTEIGVETTQPLQPANEPQPKLAAARKNLMKMFRLVRNLEMSGAEIDSSVEKNTLFDMLCESVEQYNKTCIETGYPGLQFDGEDYLQSFYNKYVYRGSNNFVRSLQLLTPLILLVYPWRLMQYGISRFYRAIGKPSYALEQKIAKSNAKDRFFLYQSVSMFGRFGQALTRAATYGIARVGVFAMTAIPLGIVTSPLWILNVIATALWAPVGMLVNFGSWKETRNDIANIWNPDTNPLTRWLKSAWEKPMSDTIDLANKARFYTVKSVGWWRTGYAKDVAIADTHSENLQELSEKAIATLERHELIVTERSQSLVMYSPKAKKAVNHSENREKQALEQHYNRVFLDVEHLQKTLTKRFQALPQNEQAILKSDPNFAELNVSGRVLERFAKKPPSNEINMKSYLKILSGYQENLKMIEKMIVRVEPHRPRNHR